MSSWEWGYGPYVSATEKRRRAQNAVKSFEKKGQKLSPIRADGRTICRSFWGQAWCDNLESYSDYANRLPRGRTYLLNGSVVDVVIVPGEVRALVTGSDLYRITIKIQPVQKTSWKALKRECAGQVGSLMDLLQGKVSGQVMEIITRRETGLFPRPAEIRLSCSCPDRAEMCKHVAATLYAVGVRLDQNPELLFELRGADHLELITEATESVTLGVSSQDDSTMLAGESLADVFGIEIEPAALGAAHPADSKSRPPKQPAIGFASKGLKNAGPRKAKAPLVNGAASKGKRRKESPREQKISAKASRPKGKAVGSGVLKLSRVARTQKKICPRKTRKDAKN
jgi:uncharacterized Zn finger protein